MGERKFKAVFAILAFAVFLSATSAYGLPIRHSEVRVAGKAIAADHGSLNLDAPVAVLLVFVQPDVTCLNAWGRIHWVDFVAQFLFQPLSSAIRPPPVSAV